MEYFILNGHSLPIARDIEDRCLKQFFDVYKEAINRNFKQILLPKYLDPHWYEIPISEGRTIRIWINEQLREYATRVKSLISSIQCIELGKEDIGLDKSSRFSEFYYNNNSVPLLGAAYSLEQLAFSFDSDKIWDEPFFLLEYKELVDTDVKVSNITTREHWNLHFKQILDERRKHALSSTDFENRLNGEFPNIIFTNDASKQLKNEHSPIFLREIWDACQKLNEVIERVEDKASYHDIIHKANLEITDESDTVKKNMKLRRHRMFRYNEDRPFFGHHIKNFSGSKRVHFIIDNNKIVIGYLGKHLPL